jgi:SAM-dependent methyltransferase
MSGWQERITQDTAPAIRVEHELRYRVAAPLILDRGVWADLGCGNGLAAAAAIPDASALRVLLVDVEREAVARAAQTLEVPDSAQLAADLTAPADLSRIGEALRGLAGEPVVTCFEVVEHLESFVPLLRWAHELVRESAATFVLSVPNDAFWSIQNPHHVTAWDERAFDELRVLLPAQHTLLRQVSLSGSAMLDWGAKPHRQALSVEVGGERAVATHFLVAFGPRHHEVRGAALAAQSDMLDQRRWERQRDSNLAYAEQTVAEQSATIATQHQELRAFVVQFDEWRAYIHELERALGRPLSGTSQEGHAESPADSTAGDHVEPQA